MSIKWHFPDNGGGLAAGFNDGAIDHFKGQRLSSLVREVVQNSLDASLSDGSPVRIKFELREVEASKASEVQKLRPSVEAARETARTQDLEYAVSFYDKAIDQLNSGSIWFLCIHDENTSGLTGPVDGPNGSWFALTKGAGLSQKIGEGSLGSFGHGSKAPFVLSNIRSLFYFTCIPAEGGGLEERFQGKSILQSHFSLETKKLTQGTGFYGESEQCRPFIDSNIPEWVRELRGENGTVGTSLLIPHTFFRADLYPETAITVIANFYYAIESGLLEINVGDEFILNRETVQKQFVDLQSRLPEEQDEIDADYVSECFKSVETIVNADLTGEQEVPNFGLLKWYLRINPDVAWRTVAIARQNGMLITRQPPQLMRFSKVKNFDMFVCVVGKKGSELLKTIENPQHDNFQFDRIDDLDGRKVAIQRYKVFSNKMREIISRHAGVELEDEVVLDELADLFSEISETTTSETSSRERSQNIQLSFGSFLSKPKKKRPQLPKPGAGGEDEIPSEGFQGGPEDRNTPGGPVPSETGATKIKGAADESNVPPKGKHYKLENLRVRPADSSNGPVIVYFDAPATGTFAFSLLKSGEIGQEKVDIKLPDGTKTKSLEVEVEEGNRESLSLTIDKSAQNLALEATIDELVE